jgi:chromosome partitioning protein
MGETEPKMLATDVASFLNITVQAIHNQLKRKNLPFKKSRNRVYFNHQVAREILNIEFDPKVITFQIVKGGTGKTAICHSVAVRTALYGAKVLCIDLDQQGNLTTAFRVKPDKTPIMVEIINQKLSIHEGIVPVFSGLDLIPSRIENALLDSNLMLKRLPLDRVYRDMILPLKEKYDFIFIDCPPALGSSVTAATLSSDFVVAPVTPSEFSLSGLQITNNEINNISETFNKSILVKILINKFDSRTSLSHETLRFLIKHPVFSQNLFNTVIRTNQEFENVITRGGSIFDTFLNSTAREDIDLLTKEILGINDKTPVSNLESLNQFNESLGTTTTSSLNQ